MQKVIRIVAIIAVILVALSLLLLLATIPFQQSLGRLWSTSDDVLALLPIFPLAQFVSCFMLLGCTILAVVFGGNKNMRAYQTAMAQFTFSFDENGTYLGHQINLIPAHVSGTDEYNNYQPVLVQGDDADEVIAAIQYDVKKLKLKPYIENVGAVQEFVPAPKK